MNEKMLPLLSDGLRKIIETIDEKHSCKIVQDLIKADDLICSYNEILRGFDYQSFFGVALESISDSISKLINDEARMLSFRHDAFEISYLPKGKEAKYSDAGIWSRENRQTAKPARIIQKLLVTEYKCKEFEDFSNWIKAEMMNAGEFKLIEGSDITKYYNDEYYYSCDGTLGNSCMRHCECSDYFGIYEDNAKMLVCFKDGLVLGRAIVWEVDGKTFMDRIYTCMDYLEGQFVDYARTNKWYYRQTNSLLGDGEYQRWYGPDDNYGYAREYDLTVKLKEHYEYMPYVDSFRYYNPGDNSINTDPYKGCIRLSNTDGSYGEEDYDIFTCAHCGREQRVYDDDDAPDDMVYSEYEDNWYCDECAVYCDGIDDYVSINTPTELVYVSRTEQQRYPVSEIAGNSDFIYLDGEYYNLDECDFIEFDEKTDKYIIKDE